jgi:CubicO group peptidase (beta-lactamase class C family)
LLNVDDLASRYKPVAASGLKPEVTIRHLLTMTSGGTLMTKPSSQRPPKLSDPPRPAGKGLDYVRLDEPEPGTPPGYGRTIPAGSRFHYDGVPADHLADIVTAASGMHSIDYITKHLLEPLGVEHFNYQPEGVDSNGNIRIGGSITLSVRDMARLGQLWLNEGRWDGRQLVSREYVRQSITPSALNASYGFLWWLNGTGRIPNASCRMFNASGAFGQYVFVVPEARLVVATMGFDAARPPQVDADLWKVLQPALGTDGCAGR